MSDIKKNGYQKLLILSFSLVIFFNLFIVNTYASDNTNIINKEENINNKLKDELLSNQEDKIKELSQILEKIKAENLSLLDKIDRLENGVPLDIDLDRWYPNRIIHMPSKLSYRKNELISLDGLKVEFIRYKKQDKKYIREGKIIDYNDFKNGFASWNFSLKTKKAIKSSGKDKKIKIKFSFIYNN